MLCESIHLEIHKKNNHGITEKIVLILDNHTKLSSEMTKSKGGVWDLAALPQLDRALLIH